MGDIFYTGRLAFFAAAQALVSTDTTNTPPMPLDNKNTHVGTDPSLMHIASTYNTRSKPVALTSGRPKVPGEQMKILRKSLARSFKDRNLMDLPPPWPTHDKRIVNYQAPFCIHTADPNTMLENLITPTLLPFNPREQVNMPLIEKVSKWIDYIPWCLSENDELMMNCFPATTSYSSSVSSVGESAFENDDADEIYELQARKVTRYATRLYLNEPEIIASPRAVCLRANSYHSDHCNKLLSKVAKGLSKLQQQ